MYVTLTFIFFSKLVLKLFPIYEVLASDKNDNRTELHENILKVVPQ